MVVACFLAVYLGDAVGGTIYERRMGSTREWRDLFADRVRFGERCDCGCDHAGPSE
ncbi:MAG: hypothetical protein AB2A00_31945 [Myxococcota bacterium]